MKVVFEKSTLLGAVTPALGSVSGKNTLPAIEGVNINCEINGKCTVTAYDLEKGFRCVIEAEVEIPGNYIINGQKLVQIVKTMPGDFVTVEVSDKMVVRISSGKSEFELHALDGKDFPMLPNLEGDRGIEIPQSVFGQMLRQSAFAIGQNSMRPELNGSYFKSENGKLTIVSCDGNRMALVERKIDLTDIKGGEGEIRMSCIVPGKTLSELVRLVGDTDDTMLLKLARKHVIFVVGPYTFFSRLIDSEYIDYKRFIPQTSKIFVKLDCDSYVGALERAMLVTEDRTLGQAKSPLRCTFTGNLLKVSSTSVTGRVYDEIFTDKVGDDIEIGFNCRYLLDALRAVDVSNIKLSLTSPLMSMIIEPAEPDEDQRFLFLVLPVKMKD